MVHTYLSEFLNILLQQAVAILIKFHYVLLVTIIKILKQTIKLINLI